MQLAQSIADAFAPLAPDASWHVCLMENTPRIVASHRAEDGLNVGSSFKAIVLAASCRAIEDDMLSLDESLTLTTDMRVPSSDETGPLPDGTAIPMRAALEAMIRSSDNTATDLVLARIGHECMQTMLESLGLSSIRIPTSIRAYLAQSEDAAGNATPIGLAGTAGEAPVASMHDLVRFHVRAFNGDLFTHRATQDLYRDILHTEDLRQGTNWRAGVACFRKGGSLDLHPFYARALAGVIEGPRGRAGFAFAFNLRQETPGDAPFDIFSKSAGRALRALEELLSDQR